MKLKALFAPIMGMVLTAACSSQPTIKDATEQDMTAINEAGDDSTIYGLACDGCTDTIVVVLRDIESDPDTFNILEASRQHKVFGRPNIGDRLALVRNDSVANVADMMIDLEDLKATWCYEVKPTLRKRAGINENDVKQFMASMPDSTKQALMAPREYGYQIKGDGEIHPIGMAYRQQTSDDETPFEYPSLKRYRRWHLNNGRLILTEVKRDSLGNMRPISSDTTTLVFLTPDTLILRFADGEQGFYRKD